MHEQRSAKSPPPSSNGESEVLRGARTSGSCATCVHVSRSTTCNHFYGGMRGDVTPCPLLLCLTPSRLALSHLSCLARFVCVNTHKATKCITRGKQTRCWVKDNFLVVSHHLRNR
uniref:Uncharacterized protein n=1 Tax=Echinococcus canadensis TaxID=519352 RepID=A0A915EVX1_9CEST